MQVTLVCNNDELIIWFAPAIKAPREIPVGNLPHAWLRYDQGGTLKALRMAGLKTQCPYELAKIVRTNMGSEIHAILQTTYDSSCDMGYIYLDYRGPSSVDFSIDTDGGVVIDIGKDGAVLGLELFSPSLLLPELVQAHSAS